MSLVSTRRRAFGRFVQLDVRQLHAQLGRQLQEVPGVDGAGDAATAARDAHARYAMAATTMASADTPGHWLVARRTVLEGLAAVAYARGEGVELPIDDWHGPQLTQPEAIQVGGRVYDGRPDYDPQHPHRYPGGSVVGRSVPGGWYAVPFWDTLLLGGVLDERTMS